MPIPDRPDYRAALSTGILVPRVLVTAVLDSDGGVTLLSVRMDFDWGPRVDLTGQGSNPQLARRCRTESASDQPLKSLPAEHLAASFRARPNPCSFVGEPDRSALRAALRVRAEQLQPPRSTVLTQRLHAHPSWSDANARAPDSSRHSAANEPMLEPRKSTDGPPNSTSGLNIIHSRKRWWSEHGAQAQSDLSLSGLVLLRVPGTLRPTRRCADEVRGWLWCAQTCDSTRGIAP